MIYLDNAATTKPCEFAVDEACRLMREVYYNPSSLHSGGIAAEAELKLARSRVAKAFGAMPGDGVYFTSGGTEGDNTVILSAASSHIKHVIVSAIEHDAVLAPAKYLESRGIEVDYARAGSDGIVSPDEIAKLLRPDTGLVSLMLVNNETGVIQPVSKVAALLKRCKSKAILHTDAVQGFLKSDKNLVSTGADIITVSAHKVHGIKGAGAIYIKKGVRLKPFILGGGQESSFRSGTEAMPAIAAFGAAVEDGMASLKPMLERVTELHSYSLSRLSSLEGAVLPGYIEHQSPFIVNVSFPGYKSEIMLHSLAKRGILVSSGAACSKGKISHVLGAMGVDRLIADSFLRISLSSMTRRDEIDALIDALTLSLGEIRKQ